MYESSSTYIFDDLNSIALCNLFWCRPTGRLQSPQSQAQECSHQTDQNADARSASAERGTVNALPRDKFAQKDSHAPIVSILIPWGKLGAPFHLRCRILRASASRIIVNASRREIPVAMLNYLWESKWTLSHERWDQDRNNIFLMLPNVKFIDFSDTSKKIFCKFR